MRTNIINERYKDGLHMGEYLSGIEILLSKLTVMRFQLNSDMQFAIPLVPDSSINSLAGSISVIKTMESERETWKYITTSLIKEIKTYMLAEVSACRMPAAAASTSKGCRRDLSVKEYHKCNIFGYMKRRCRSKEACS